MPVVDHPPMISFTHFGTVDANFLLLPTGNSNNKLASSTWVLLKSDSARSKRQLWISVGVRLKLVVLNPPPVAAPVGSTDMSSIDLLNVYERPKSNPCSKRRRAVTNRPW